MHRLNVTKEGDLTHNETGLWFNDGIGRRSTSLGAVLAGARRRSIVGDVTIIESDVESGRIDDMRRHGVEERSHIYGLGVDVRYDVHGIDTIARRAHILQQPGTEREKWRVVTEKNNTPIYTGK